MHIRTAILAVVALAMTLALPTVAPAAQKGSPSKESTAPGGHTYNLDFMLPTVGKSGCLVCHGDPNLVKIGPDATSTIFVDVEKLKTTAHADTLCTGCHSDFAFTAPHKNAVDGQAWRRVAKTACKTCHQPEFTDYSQGAHSPAARSPLSTATPAPAPGQTRSAQPTVSPTCGDCHIGHSIPSKDDTAALRVYRRQGLEICGRCHKEFADNYVDYYHGAAYRRGAPDAPTCWDCHGAHEVLPADDRDSPVNPANLSTTCGQTGCHQGVETDTFQAYAKLIHRRSEVLQANPIWSALDTARQGVNQAVGFLTGLFKKR